MGSNLDCADEHADEPRNQRHLVHRLSTFATVRLRHKSTKGNGSSAASVAMAFKLCLQAEKNWRRLRGFKQLELVAKNIIFVDGEEKKAA